MFTVTRIEREQGIHLVSHVAKQYPQDHGLLPSVVDTYYYVVEIWYLNCTTIYSPLTLATASHLYFTHHEHKGIYMLRLRVQEVAQEKGVSMSKLSLMADVNYKTSQTIWRNPYHGLNTITLNKIAQALGVPTSELIEDVPDD